MIKAGKHLEEIIEMLIRLQAEIQISNTLGLTNISKHSENFVRTLLNLVYEYDLENLNKDNSNFPGLDLGDIDEKIAYQITATKKSEKIDDTLSTCIKFEHYKIFDKIKIFTLTKKQRSYSLKTETEPKFYFDTNVDIVDFNMIIKEIENLPQFKIEKIYKFVKNELASTIESINKNENYVDGFTFILDPQKTLKTTGLDSYSLWNTTILLKSEAISIPKIHAKLNWLLKSSELRMKYLPIFDEKFRKESDAKSNDLIYADEIQKTHASNYFYGFGLKLGASSITIEKANFTNDLIVLNLRREMEMIIVAILCLSSLSTQNLCIQISSKFDANNDVFLSSATSLIIKNLFGKYYLSTQTEPVEVVSDIKTQTLAELLQSLAHIFMSKSNSFFPPNPYVEIDRQFTEENIELIKKEFNISNSIIIF